MSQQHGIATIRRIARSVREFSLVAGLAVGALVAGADADVEVIAIDFGQGAGDNCGESPLYTGTFDGASDFIAMTISNCGIVESPQVDLGNGATFGFTDVTGWNNTDGAGGDDVRALTGDHFFSNWQGSGPVSFALTGLDPDAIVVLEFADRKGGERALVTFEGVTTMVDGVGGDDGVFTTVGVVTGSSSYSGSFTGPDGGGEGNLCGARISIITESKASGATVACCFGMDCWDIGINDCIAASGVPEGKGSVCDADSCAPPELLECCVEGEGLPGCLDVDCANAVCLDLPHCCEMMWDADCAAAAIEICNDCNGTTDVVVTAIDLGPGGGCSEGLVYTGTFDATMGFRGMEISDCCAVENPEFDLGDGVVLQFFANSGWNNTDGRPVTDSRSLTGDHFFSAGCGADEFVQFEVRGLDPCDLLILQFADRRGGERALVTFEGMVTLVDAVGDYESDPAPDGYGFEDVSGGGVSGKSTYMGEFTGADGGGEGNLAAAKITIVPGGGDCADPCPGDFNGDGTVDGADFGALVAAWGACPDCPQDLDGDGVVTGSDVGLFVSVWGGCP